MISETFRRGGHFPNTSLPVCEREEKGNNLWNMWIIRKVAFVATVTMQTSYSPFLKIFISDSDHTVTLDEQTSICLSLFFSLFLEFKT